MNLITQKLKLAESGLDFADELIEDLLKSPAAPFREEKEIEYVLKFNAFDLVDEKVLPKITLGKGQLLHWITTDAIDRDYEIMQPKGMQTKWYRKNPVVLESHTYRDLTSVIGRNMKLMKQENGVLAITQMDVDRDYVAEVHGMYQRKFLNAWSVGFVPLKGYRPKVEDGGAESWPPKEGKVWYVHQKWELLEYSAVSVPSNPEAFTEQVAKEYKLSDTTYKRMLENIKEHQEGTPDDSKAYFILEGEGSLEADEKEKKESEEPEAETAEPEGEEESGKSEADDIVETTAKEDETSITEDQVAAYHKERGETVISSDELEAMKTELIELRAKESVYKTLTSPLLMKPEDKTIRPSLIALDSEDPPQKPNDEENETFILEDSGEIKKTSSATQGKPDGEIVIKLSDIENMSTELAKKVDFKAIVSQIIDKKRGRVT